MHSFAQVDAIRKPLVAFEASPANTRAPVDLGVEQLLRTASAQVALASLRAQTTAPTAPMRSTIRPHPTLAVGWTGNLIGAPLNVGADDCAIACRMRTRA